MRPSTPPTITTTWTRRVARSQLPTASIDSPSEAQPVGSTRERVGLVGDDHHQFELVHHRRIIPSIPRVSHDLSET
jgi:hypothetical protein